MKAGLGLKISFGVMKRLLSSSHTDGLFAANKGNVPRTSRGECSSMHGYEPPYIRTQCYVYLVLVNSVITGINIL